MSKWNYDFIASDLDGTLLSPQRTISERAVAAIKAFGEGGGRFTLATGRFEETVEAYVKQTSITCPLILYNGAKVVDMESPDDPLLEMSLDKALAAAAFEALYDIGKYVFIYSGRVVYAKRQPPREIIKISNENAGFSILPSFDAIGSITKFLVLDPLMEWDKIKAAALPILGDAVTHVHSEPVFWEVMPKDASKGNALEFLAGVLGIPLSRTVAIGDHMNDISMLEKAGLPVAIGNAEEPVKAVATHVTGSNADDGVAQLLEAIMRGEL